MKKPSCAQPVTVHVDPDNRRGWATFRKLPKGCKAVSVRFDKSFTRPEQFRVPKKQRKYIYIVVSARLCMYRLPKGCRAVVLWNCGGAGVP